MRDVVDAEVEVDSEGQREAIVEFYRRMRSAETPHNGNHQTIDRELAGMLAIWDEVSSAHDDPWRAIRNECAMYRFDNHWPWASAATSDNFLLTIRAVLEGRGSGISSTPYDIR